MTDALKVFGRSFRDWWDEMFLMVGVNLMWGLLAIALVTIFPGTMGAYYLTREKALGRRVEFDLFWQGFRQYFGKAWALGAINVAVTVLLVSNIWFYANISNWLAYLTLIWIYILVMWLGVLLYVFPMALGFGAGGQEPSSYLQELRHPRLRPAAVHPSCGRAQPGAAGVEPGGAAAAVAGLHPHGGAGGQPRHHQMSTNAKMPSGRGPGRPGVGGLNHGQRESRP